MLKTEHDGILRGERGRGRVEERRGGGGTRQSGGAALWRSWRKVMRSGLGGREGLSGGGAGGGRGEEANGEGGYDSL